MSATEFGGLSAQDGASDRATNCFLSFRQTGSIEDLEQALLLCSPSLHRAASMMGKSAEAGDLVNDAFVVAIDRANGFDGSQRLLPWLHGILRNSARARHGRRWAKLRSFDAIEEAPAPSDEPRPDEIVERQEWRSHTEACVAELAEPYRSIVTAHLFHGERPSHIASRLGRSRSTVRSQISRGMDELRRRLPAPLLFGLTAMLATRTAEAGTGVAGPRMKLGVLAPVAAMLVATATWLSWPPEVAPAQTGKSVEVPRIPGGQPGGNPGTGGEEPTNNPRKPAPSVRPRVTLKVRHGADDGPPAVGIPVLLAEAVDVKVPINRRHHEWRIATTDEHGVVEFEDVPPGLGIVQFSDHAGGGIKVEVGRVNLEQVVSVKVASWLQVSVQDEQGQPVAGADVYSSYSAGVLSPGYLAGRTGADGIARVFGTRYPMHYWVRADGFFNTKAYPVWSLGSEAKPHRCEVTLERGGHACVGRVQNADGDPVADVLVAGWSESGERLPTSYVQTDASGHFEFPGMRDAPWMAYAFRDGYACTHVSVPSAETRADLRLTAGGRLSGRVQDLADKARVVRVLSRHLGRRDDPFTIARADADADGRFVFENLRPGRHEFSFYLGSTKPFERREVVVREGGQHTVEMKTPWMVRVADPRGRPIGACTVILRSSQPDVWGECLHEATVNMQGVAHLPFYSQGTYELGVQVGSVPGTWVKGVHPEALTTLTVDEQIRELGSVAGRLTAEARALATKPQIELVCHRTRLPLVLGDGGTFRFDDVPPGPYSLQVVGGGDGGQTIIRVHEFTVEPGVDLELGNVGSPAMGSVTVRCAEAQASSAVAVALRDPKGKTFGSWAVHGGQPSKQLLPVGDYELVFFSADAREVALPFQITAGGDTNLSLKRHAGKPCRIEVKYGHMQQEHCLLRGTLKRLDASEGIELQFEQEVAGGPGVHSLDLLPGSYVLEARSPWGKSTGGPVIVEADSQGVQTTRFTIR